MEQRNATSGNVVRLVCIWDISEHAGDDTDDGVAVVKNFNPKGFW